MAPMPAPVAPPTNAPVAVLSGRPEGVSHPITRASPIAAAVRLMEWYFIFQLLVFLLDKFTHARVRCNSPPSYSMASTASAMDCASGVKHPKRGRVSVVIFPLD